MEENKQTLYTAEGFQALVQELEELKNVKMVKVKEDLARARSFGDLTENSEYDEAKDEQGKTFSRIAELEELIANAKIVEEDELQFGVVNLGCTVKVLFLDGDEEETYTLVGSNEVDAFQHKISDQSPIGAAMMSAKAGQTVTYEMNGHPHKLKILDVTRTERHHHVS